MEAENKEPWARIEALEKKEGEGVQGGQGLPSRRESGLEEGWGVEMDLEDEVESRKKLDEQTRKLQKELRDIEKFSCVPKEFHGNLRSCLQQQLQEVEQGRHDLMPEHQKSAEKIRKRHKAFRKTEEICKKKVLQHKRRCGRSERKWITMSSVFSSCRTKSNRTKKSMQRWQQNVRGCRPDKKEEAVKHRRQVIAAWRPCGNSLSPWERIELRSFVHRLQREMGTAQEQMSGREGGRRNSENEQEQDKASQQLALSASSGCNEGSSE